MLEAMRISELGARTGVSAHRLRRYESMGLISSTRTPGGYREYAEAVVREVTFIAMGRQIGFTLGQLAETLPRYRAGTLSIDEMIEALRARIAEIDALVASQQALRQRLCEHIGWFEARKRRAAGTSGTSRPWPGTKGAGPSSKSKIPRRKS